MFTTHNTNVAKWLKLSFFYFNIKKFIIICILFALLILCQWCICRIPSLKPPENKVDSVHISGNCLSDKMIGPIRYSFQPPPTLPPFASPNVVLLLDIRKCWRRYQVHRPLSRRLDRCYRVIWIAAIESPEIKLYYDESRVLLFIPIFIITSKFCNSYQVPLKLLRQPRTPRQNSI